ncbi:hypothetical protein, partial [Acetobacter sp. DsW_063]|uniref:hypothetical protein n=1 Tax=Acetobacter sp. DsW_063 TaxID=1514894 RepID=UPI001E65CB7B
SCRAVYSHKVNVTAPGKLLPSRTDLASPTHKDLAGTECLMNGTPRKCLGYLTLAKAMDRLIESFSPRLRTHSLR